MNKEKENMKYHVLWLGAGFSRDIGLPMFDDFLKHTELLYNYEGIIPLTSRKILDGNEMFVPLADANRRVQPTDKDDKNALEIVSKFKKSLCLPKKKKFNLEEIFKKARKIKDKDKRGEIEEAIMRIVVRTFDLALHYRYRDFRAWKRIFSSEIIFWGNYPVLTPCQRFNLYEKFLRLLEKPDDGIAIITPNWDASLMEVWTKSWLAKDDRKKELERIGRYDTIPLPGFNSKQERVPLEDVLKQRYKLPGKDKRIFYLPIHGAANLVKCVECNEPFFVGGEVHSYKYREDYRNVGGWHTFDGNGDKFQMICTNCHEKTEPKKIMPILSPPTDKQTATRNEEEKGLNQIREKAAEILSKAISIHFIGYSFPRSDKEIKKFIIDNTPKDKKCRVTVTCPEAYENLKKWGGYPVLEKIKCCVDIRSNRSTLQHFISDPPWPFSDLFQSCSRPLSKRA